MYLLISIGFLYCIIAVLFNFIICPFLFFNKIDFWGNRNYDFSCDQNGNGDTRFFISLLWVVQILFILIVFPGKKLFSYLDSIRQKILFPTTSIKSIDEAKSTYRSIAYKG